MPKLTGLIINRIALVDKGDNPRADIVLWKRKKEADMTEQELQDKLDAATAALAEATAKAEAAEKRATDLEAELQKDKDPPDPLEKADPQIKAVVKALEEKAQAAEKRAEEQQDRLAKIEDASAHAAMVKRIGDELPNFGRADDLAGILKKAASALSEDENTTLWATFKAANAQIDQTVLFKELGVEGSEGTDPEAKLTAMAQARAAEHDEDFHVAYAKVIKSAAGSELYAQYQRDHTKRNREG